MNEAESLLLDLSVAVTEMFRDPAFFRALREVVFPSSPGTRTTRFGLRDVRVAKKRTPWPSC